MENQFAEIEKEQNQNKRPLFLTVLVILTWMWTAISIMNSFTALVNGPMDDEMMKEQELAAAETISELKESGQDGEEGEFVQMIELGLERMKYVNEEAFMRNYLTILVVSILGAIAAYLMWTRKKTGFHLYIIYTLSYIGMAYLIYPASMVINMEVYINLLIGGLFVILYSRNLHAMS